jgi:hypothetical protein
MSLKATLRPATAAEMRASLRQASNGLMRTTPQAAHTLGQGTRHEATVIDGGTQMFAGQQATPSTISQTRMRPPVSQTESEATVVDSKFDLTRPSIESYSRTSVYEPPAQEGRKNSPALIGVALAVLIACAFVAFPLLKSPVASPATIELQTGTQPAETQPVAPDATQTGATRQTSNSTSVSERPSSPELRSAGESQPQANQVSNREAEAAGGSAVNGDGAKGFSPAVEASESKSGLVIQSPAPSSSPGVKNNAAAEYDAQRAEDLRRRKEQQALELQQQREREQFRPPPPPPGGGYPGDGHRPPPHRPPPMR